MSNTAAPSSWQQWNYSLHLTVEVFEWMNGNLVFHLYLGNQKAKNSEIQSIDSSWGALMNETIAVFLGDWSPELWPFKGISFGMAYLWNAQGKLHHIWIEASQERALSNEPSHKVRGGLGREFRPFKIGGPTNLRFVGGALPRPATTRFDQEPGEDLTIKIWARNDFPFSSYEWICIRGRGLNAVLLSFSISISQTDSVTQLSIIILQ